MAGNGTSAAAGDSIGPSARAAMVVLVLALHVGGSWALLRHAQRVDRAGTVTPIEVSFIVPPTPVPPAPVPSIVPPQPAPAPPLAEPAPPLPVTPVAQPPEPQPSPRPRPKPVRAKRRPPPAPPVIASATHTPEPAAMSAPPAPVASPPSPPFMPPLMPPLAPPLPPAATAVAAASPPPPPPPAPAPRDVAITAVAYRTPPVLEYPLASRRMQEHGRVQVRVLVDVQGRPREFQIVRSSGFARLDEAALATVRATRFKPYTEDGKARPFWVLMPLVFELER